MGKFLLKSFVVLTCCGVCGYWLWFMLSGTFLKTNPAG
jgi:hypothetical protein